MYAKPRSCNNELSAGMTDGKYKKVIADRGGEVEHTFVENRRHLIDGYYGVHESPSMMRPDGRQCTNPYAVPMPEADPAYF